MQVFHPGIHQTATLTTRNKDVTSTAGEVVDQKHIKQAIMETIHFSPLYNLQEYLFTVHLMITHSYT